MEDDRRNKGRFTVMGLTKGQVISIGIATLAVLSGLFTQYEVWGSALNQIKTNTVANEATNKRMEAMNTELHEQITRVKDELIKRIDQQTKRQDERAKETRRDIKEILRALK